MLNGFEPPPPDPIIEFMHTVDVVCGEIMAEKGAMLAAAFREYVIDFAMRRRFGLPTQHISLERNRLKDRLRAENYWHKRKVVDTIDTLIDLSFPMASDT
jgi:hypothetical protein